MSTLWGNPQHSIFFGSLVYYHEDLYTVALFGVGWKKKGNRSYKKCVHNIIDMQPSFSQLYIIQKLPSYMNNARAALKSNSIRCSFCAETVLTVIGKLAINSCYSLLCRFDSEEAFIEHCVKEGCLLWIHWQGYQTWWKSSSFYEKRFHQISFLDRCKILAMKMCKKRESDEHYFGRSSFSDDLHRSFMNLLLSLLVH